MNTHTILLLITCAVWNYSTKNLSTSSQIAPHICNITKSSSAFLGSFLGGWAILCLSLHTITPVVYRDLQHSTLRCKLYFCDMSRYERCSRKKIFHCTRQPTKPTAMVEKKKKIRYHTSPQALRELFCILYTFPPQHSTGNLHKSRAPVNYPRFGISHLYIFQAYLASLSSSSHHIFKKMTQLFTWKVTAADRCNVTEVEVRDPGRSFCPILHTSPKSTVQYRADTLVRN